MFFNFKVGDKEHVRLILKCSMSLKKCFLQNSKKYFFVVEISKFEIEIQLSGVQEVIKS